MIDRRSARANCYAVILCKPYVHKTKKDVVDEKILEAMDEEDRRHYAAKYGIPYQSGESSHAKGEERKEA